ncbi:MAG TPA: beta-ketoacyl synthase N-terminal-like domain-containing protein, partial [Longimicrobiales bacterium]|nr:beta-ketoacyl synthase N-terminal-like domain-containing protein [Longimicrobiales bacterium]
MKTVIVDGCRTPFCKAGTALQDLTAIELGKVAVRELLARADLPGDEVDQLVYGTVVHNPHAPNIAREVGLAVLPRTVPATTVSRACITANQAITDAVNLIESGNADVVVAGGAESLSHIPITVTDELSRILVGASKAKSLGETLGVVKDLRPKDLIPVRPDIAEPTTGETM